MNLTDALQIQDDPTPPTAGQLVAIENMARQRIAEWWDRADRTESYPASDDDAVALVNSVEYSITREELVRFIQAKAFTGVPTSNRQRQWSARDVARLATFLECRRDWMAGSELHRAKKTPYEVALEMFRETGETPQLFADLPAFDLKSLLLMLTESENRQQREILYVAVQLKLESYCITI